MLLTDGLSQALGTRGLLSPFKAAGELLTLQPFKAVGTLIKAPFNIIGGVAKAALGVVTAPFELIGGLFGGGSSRAAAQGAQNAVANYV